MKIEEMTAKMAEGQGFLAALDQSGGSTPKALRAYGIKDDEWAGEEQMFALIHQMRDRIITAPAFTGDKVIGTIMFERTMDGMIDGKPTPAALMDRGVVPFIKIDKGLEEEANGVRLMKPMPEVDALLTRARGLGVFGTKERSVINAADPEGIAAIVDQQFKIAETVLGYGMIPILEPEYNLSAPDRADGEEILKQQILENLEALPTGMKVMLKLSIPKIPGTFDDLAAHAGVLRLVALSGGYSQEEACSELAKNKGMIASFSRALLEGLRIDMSDADFDAALRRSIDAIYDASVNKVAA